jgi:hypothetical protein
LHALYLHNGLDGTLTQDALLTVILLANVTNSVHAS